MNKMKEWRLTPVTLGLLGALTAVIVTVIATTWKVGDEFEQTCKKAVSSHQDRDVDRSHPDLTKKYMPRTEIGDRLHTIDRKLDRVDVQQTVILREIRRNGHPRRRRRNP